jgi:hypothetical protein
VVKWGIWVAGTALSSVLVGCGGGGGTMRGTPVPTFSSDYPGLANITTPTGLNTLAESAVVNTGVGGPSAASAGGGGASTAIQWSNTLIRVQVTNVAGQSFTMDFPTSSLSNVGVGGVPFTGTLAPVVGTAPGSSQTILTTQIGVGSNSFDHTVLGRWTYQTTLPPAINTVGFFVAGTETRQQDLPTSGTAAYSGRLLANLYQTGNPIGTVVGNATGNVNFASGVFNFSTSSSTLNGAADASVNVTGSLSRPTGIPASNGWTGTIQSDATRNLSGSINGRCYGPACVEFGGTFFMTAPGQQMLGGILLKQ